jgi:acyl-coenzyme A thioesterase PaaI-like protein
MAREEHEIREIAGDEAQVAAVADAWMPLRAGVLTVVSAELGTAEVALSPRPWLIADGAVTLGGLALAADDALGMALTGALPRPSIGVAVQLNVELIRKPTPGAEIRALGNVIQVDDRGGVASGSVVDGRTGHTLAIATLRNLVAEGASIDAAQAAPAEVMEPTTETISTADPFFANPLGVIHGGILMILAERSASLAHPGRTPLALQGTFLRPVFANGLELHCRTSDIRTGRRLVATTADISGADGVLAMTASVVLGEARASVRC